MIGVFTIRNLLSFRLLTGKNEHLLSYIHQLFTTTTHKIVFTVTRANYGNKVDVIGCGLGNGAGTELRGVDARLPKLGRCGAGPMV
jgi:hypothetical protein